MSLFPGVIHVTLKPHLYKEIRRRQAIKYHVMTKRKKRPKLVAMLGHRCPRCHEGKLFGTGAFAFSKPFEMRGSCDQCGQNYYPEPGFYYGAMFIGYIITAFFSLGLVGFCILVLDWSVEGSFALLLAVMAVMFVWFFRTARSVWIHLTVKYDPTAIETFDPDSNGQLPEFVNKNF